MQTRHVQLLNEEASHYIQSHPTPNTHILNDCFGQRRRVRGMHQGMCAEGERFKAATVKPNLTLTTRVLAMKRNHPPRAIIK